MATRGLSLVGFYDQERDALAHLRNTCLIPDGSDASLLKEWAAAKGKSGQPMPRAGQPEVREFALAESAYIRELCAQPWVQGLLKKPAYRGASFKLVEIEPLLVHQPFVDLERAARVCQPLSGPAVADLMPICLPRAQPKPLEPPAVTAGGNNSLAIKMRHAHIEFITPELATVVDDGYESTLAAARLHWSLPFINVVRIGGRHLLRSGNHRVFGAAKQGATHIPCLVREASDHNGSEVASESPDWLMIPRRVLESGNPPTMAHYLRGRAHDVMLRATSVVLQITWAYHILPDEFEGL